MTTPLTTVMSDRCNVTRSQIINFCQQWKIIEFALFGSVLRDDFRDDSDIDVLLTHSPA
ncbi:nucleotidyltransferase domain-containing protein [Phormidesmis priestleyi]